MDKLGLALVLGFFAEACSLEWGDACVTPNGESALCVALDSCRVLRDALLTGNETVRAFVAKSECGFKEGPLVCCGTAGHPTHTFLTNALPDATSCGLEKVDDRVFGGELTEIGEFPWMVLLGYTSPFSEDVEFKCGGTLINNRWVLTAAHCLRVKRRAGMSLDLVRLGEWRISTEADCSKDLANDECSDPVLDIQIEKTVSHLGYNKKSGDNDIALLRLISNIPYTDYIRPICLPSNDKPRPVPGVKLVVSGWGLTENGSLSDVKLKLKVPVIPSTDCLGQVKPNGDVTENQLCAGGEKGKDACKGDSGGPLMGTLNRTDSKNQWYQEGVVAWGVGCGRRNVPGVYTRVSRYVNWIKENIY